MTAAPSWSVPVVEPGEELAPGYVVVEHVSRGEALDVYEVSSAERLCSCVAKTVRPDRAHVPRVRDRLRQEGALLQELAHPHLLRGFETVLVDGVPVVVTETLPGLSLEEIVEARTRRLPATDLAHLGQQLCAAVDALHRHGWLHLDIRPANVLGTAGRAVLIDLSLARRPGPAPRGVGTPEYMAPEQVRGGELGPPADVWGLGVTLWEAAAGRPAFDAAVRHPQLAAPAPALSSVRRGLPRPLVTAVHGCLEPAPADRPTVRELWAALGDVLSDHAE